MKKFTSNSSYKIIRICEDENIKLTFDTYYKWEKRNFDIINIPDDTNVLDIILSNNQVDAIVVQFDDYESRTFDNLNKLPNYYKRKIYYYDTKDNYGIDLALRINTDQLTHHSDPTFSIVTLPDFWCQLLILTDSAEKSILFWA